ncbi:hypothetical protein TNIN_235711 [Trichonephila inaurata madagascariensis]|uniref:Uncharacterized protein n=1 Tax=Trichonephila inaurata madagascariensis TaxID=2747483 RepID=A0A8X6XSE0_9ARAC|nr:hypothetical protein TNIN_235711 [Trichonephila inaurata madagascariensis]
MDISLPVFGEHFETFKNIRFSGKNLSDELFDAYAFVSSNNEECEIFENNIEVAEKQKQINPKMPPKRWRLESQRNVTRSSRMAIWKDKENAAYSYNPSIDYKYDALCILRPMSITCQFCSAVKFKGETPGLYVEVVGRCICLC